MLTQKHKRAHGKQITKKQNHLVKLSYSAQNCNFEQPYKPCVLLRRKHM